MTLLYPRILAIHDLKDHVGFPAGPQGRLQMPALMRAGYGWMVAEGAYLMSEFLATWWSADACRQDDGADMRIAAKCGTKRAQWAD